jgi:hypothetical protein
MKNRLEPLSLTRILDRAFALYRARVGPFALVALPAVLLMLLLHLADDLWLHSHRSANTGYLPGQIMLEVLIYIAYSQIASLPHMFLMPALCRLGSAQLFEEPMGLRTLWAGWRARWGRNLRLALLRFAVVVLGADAAGVALLAGIGLWDDVTNTMGHLGNVAIFSILSIPLIFGIVCTLWLGARTALAIPAAELEQLPAWAAIRRSWRLTRGSALRIALAWFAVFAFALAVTWSVSYTGYWAYRLIFPHVAAHMALYNGYRIAMPALNVAVACLVAPLYPIVVTLLYYDVRIRREALDLERMIEEAVPVVASADSGEGEDATDPA